jgi:SAM-dependent methyltransferase
MQTAPQPDDPCPCTSGLRYGDCHQQINEAPPSQTLDVGRRLYAERWRGNAEVYEAQGLYHRLAQHLSSFGRLARVIDIGCGRGEGLVALQGVTDATGMLLVGLDENPDCLKAAAERLGISSPRKRLKRIGRGGRKYDLEVVPRRLPRLAPIVLAQTDFLRPDPELDSLIAEAAPYDAVTLWFTGIHPAREHDEVIKSLEITSDPMHRMATDLAALEYAARFVRSGGCFHVVTRFAGTERAELQAEAETDMQALGEHGPVQLAELVLLPYDEPVSSTRIGVGASALLRGSAETFAASAIFRITR